eukprot:gene30361-35366_t
MRRYEGNLDSANINVFCTKKQDWVVASEWYASMAPSWGATGASHPQSGTQDSQATHPIPCGSSNSSKRSTMVGRSPLSPPHSLHPVALLTCPQPPPGPPPFLAPPHPVNPQPPLIGDQPQEGVPPHPHSTLIMVYRSLQQYRAAASRLRNRCFEPTPGGAQDISPLPISIPGAHLNHCSTMWDPLASQDRHPVDPPRPPLTWTRTPRQHHHLNLDLAHKCTACGLTEPLAWNSPTPQPAALDPLDPQPPPSGTGTGQARVQPPRIETGAEAGSRIMHGIIRVWAGQATGIRSDSRHMSRGAPPRGRDQGGALDGGLYSGSARMAERDMHYRGDSREAPPNGPMPPPYPPNQPPLPSQPQPGPQPPPEDPPGCTAGEPPPPPPPDHAPHQGSATDPSWPPEHGQHTKPKPPSPPLPSARPPVFSEGLARVNDNLRSQLSRLSKLYCCSLPQAAPEPDQGPQDKGGAGTPKLRQGPQYQALMKLMFSTAATDFEGSFDFQDEDDVAGMEIHAIAGACTSPAHHSEDEGGDEDDLDRSPGCLRLTGVEREVPADVPPGTEAPPDPRPYWSVAKQNNGVSPPRPEPLYLPALAGEAARMKLVWEQQQASLSSGTHLDSMAAAGAAADAVAKQMAALAAIPSIPSPGLALPASVAAVVGEGGKSWRDEWNPESAEWDVGHVKGERSRGKSLQELREMADAGKLSWGVSVHCAIKSLWLPLRKDPFNPWELVWEPPSIADGAKLERERSVANAEGGLDPVEAVLMDAATRRSIHSSRCIVMSMSHEAVDAHLSELHQSSTASAPSSTPAVPVKKRSEADIETTVAAVTASSRQLQEASKQSRLSDADLDGWLLSTYLKQGHTHPPLKREVKRSKDLDSQNAPSSTSAPSSPLAPASSLGPPAPLPPPPLQHVAQLKHKVHQALIQREMRQLIRQLVIRGFDEWLSKEPQASKVRASSLPTPSPKEDVQRLSSLNRSSTDPAASTQLTDGAHATPGSTDRLAGGRTPESPEARPSAAGNKEAPRSSAKSPPRYFESPSDSLEQALADYTYHQFNRAKQAEVTSHDPPNSPGVKHLHRAASKRSHSPTLHRSTSLTASLTAKSSRQTSPVSDSLPSSLANTTAPIGLKPSASALMVNRQGSLDRVKSPLHDPNPPGGAGQALPKGNQDRGRAPLHDPNPPGGAGQAHTKMYHLGQEQGVKASNISSVSSPFEPHSKTVPPDSKAVPPDSKTVPPDSKTVPPDSKTVPPDSKTVPSDSKTVPPERSHEAGASGAGNEPTMALQGNQAVSEGALCQAGKLNRGASGALPKNRKRSLSPPERDNGLGSGGYTGGGTRAKAPVYYGDPDTDESDDALLIPRSNKLKRKGSEDVKAAKAKEAELMNSIRTGLRAVLNKLKSIDKDECSGVFSFPVSPDDAADYLDVIKHPMDLNTMSQQLATGYYSSDKEGFSKFQEHAERIGTNCLTYNTAKYWMDLGRLFRKSAHDLCTAEWKKIEMAVFNLKSGRRRQ